MTDKSSQRKGILTNLSALTAFSLFEKALAFLFQLAIAAVFGASLATDSYYSASQLYDLIDSTLLGAIVVAMINRFSSISATEGEERAFEFASEVNGLVVVVMLGISCCVFAFAGPVSVFVAPGFDDVNRQTLVTCIRLMAAIPMITVTSSITQAILRHKEEFILANSRSLFISLFGLAAVAYAWITSEGNNPFILCVGYIVSNLFFAGALYLRTLSYGKLRYCAPRISDEIRTLLRLALPTMVSTGVLRVSLVIDQVLSSLTGPGAITCLSYAQSLYNMVSSLLIVNLGVILLTEFTKLRLEHNEARLIERIHQSISLATIALLPITLVCTIFPREIVEIVYEHGAFSHESTGRVAGLLLYYSIGFLPAMVNTVYTQVLYSYGQMKTAMTNSLMSLFVNIVISIATVAIIGQNGVAIGTTVSAFVGVILNWITVSRTLERYHSVFDMGFVIRLLVAAVTSCLVLFGVKSYVESALVSFILASLLAFTVTLVTMVVFHEETLCSFLGRFSGRAH